MIDQVLRIIIEDLNSSLKLKFKISEPRVIISNLVNQDGGIPPQNSNRIICSLINIENERIRSNGGFVNAGTAVKNPPVNLDLFVMFSSNYHGENYLEGLKILSMVIGFFQSKALFTTANTPQLSNVTEKIFFNLHNMDLGNLSHLWGALGCKYMPSVIYQVKMITITEDRLLGEQSPIIGFGTSTE